MKVRIPDKIEGEPVTGIGREAFAESGIMYVYVPNSVTSIGDNAFLCCAGLTSITIPDDVTIIGHRAFSGCTALADVAYSGEVKVGFPVYFGGILWRVLEVQDGKALIISEDVLLKGMYHSVSEPTTWEECDLRRYLNDDFCDSTFSEEEKGRILESMVINDDNTERGVAGGNDTTDKVFILDYSEVKQYFAEESAWLANNSNGKASWWYLRSPAFERGYSMDEYYFVSGICNDGRLGAICLDGNRSIDKTGVHYQNTSLDGNGIRPAMWITL